MTRPSLITPWEALGTYVDSQASGEFICATPGVEIHVYLQQGRLAWATHSAAPLAFRRYLLQHGGITAEAMSQVMEECRKLRRPLGETLVAWGLASMVCVRSALSFQLCGALEGLRNLGAVHSIFLPRQHWVGTYNPELTFALDELPIVGDAARAQPRSAS